MSVFSKVRIDSELVYLETPSLVWFCRYLPFIKSNVNRIWFYNWWNRDLLAVPETNSGCDIFKSCWNYCASRSMSRMCVASVNESPHTRIKQIVNENEPTKFFEDNSACVAQLKEGYLKSDRTKHISPWFYSYIRKFEKNKEVDIEYIRSCKNPADLFTKTLPTTTFRKHVYGIGMRRLRDLWR